MRWTIGFAALLLVAGCTMGPDDEMVEPTTTETVTTAPKKPEVTKLPVGTAGLKVADIAWSQGSTVHIGDQMVDLAPLEVEEFVVAEGGIYLLSKGELWFSDLSSVVPVGLARVRELAISIDGWRLGLIDYESGERDRYDTPLAAAVAFDTRTGERLARTSAGLGSTKSVDLADLYEDATPRALGFDDSTFYLQGIGALVAVPLGGGEPKEVGTAPVLSRKGTDIGADQQADLAAKANGEAEAEPFTGTLGPGEKYGVAGDSSFDFLPFDAATGELVRVSIKHRRFVFGGWTGPSTFYGKAMDDAAGAAGGYVERGIWSCDLAAPSCDEVVPAADVIPGVEVRFASGVVSVG